MADIGVGASTVVARNVTGNQRVFIQEYTTGSGMTTAAGSQSVAVPLLVVEEAHAFFVASSALTTATIVSAAVSSVAGEVIVTKSTFTATIPIRVVSKGR